MNNYINTGITITEYTSDTLSYFDKKTTYVGEIYENDYFYKVVNKSGKPTLEFLLCEVGSIYIDEFAYNSDVDERYYRKRENVVLNEYDYLIIASLYKSCIENCIVIEECNFIKLIGSIRIQLPRSIGKYSSVELAKEAYYKSDYIVNSVKNEADCKKIMKLIGFWTEAEIEAKFTGVRPKRPRIE